MVLAFLLLGTSFTSVLNVHPAHAASTLLNDNFTQDSALNTNLWTYPTSTLSTMATETSECPGNPSCPPSTFVTPQLTFSSLSSPMISNGQAYAQSNSLTLPTGGQAYIYGFSDGGRQPTTSFQNGELYSFSVADAVGQTADGIAITTSNTNSFTTSDSSYSITGAEISGYSTFTSFEGDSGSNPDATTASVTFTVSVANSLTVIVALASSQSNLVLSGPTLTVAAESVIFPGGTDPVEIAYGYLSPGTYTVTETTAPTCTDGCEIGAATDLIGAFVFAAPKSSGMDMQGAVCCYTFTGIQSVNSFSLPLDLKAEVTMDQSYGGTFELTLVNSQVTNFIRVIGNALPQQYFPGIFVMDGSTGFNNYGQRVILDSSPQTGVAYVVDISVDSTGYATVNLEDTTGNVIGSASNLFVGTGSSYYVVLAQSEGAPPLTGPNEATWADVELSSPSTPLSVTVSPTYAATVLGSVIGFGASATGGSGTYVDYYWHWTGAAVGSYDSGTSDQFIFVPVIVGNYQVYVVVTDSLGSSKTSQNVPVSVAAPQSPWSTKGPESIGPNKLAGKVNTLSISSDMNTIYAGSGIGQGSSGPYSDGGAYLTTNGGSHWSQIDGTNPNALTDTHVSAILMNPANSQIALAGTWDSGIFRTSTGGTQWSNVDPAVSQVDTILAFGNSVFAGTSNGIISSDINSFGSNPWSMCATCSTNEAVRVLVAASPQANTMYAGLDSLTSSGSPVVMISTDGGISWNSTTGSLPPNHGTTYDTIWSMAASPNPVHSKWVYAVVGPFGGIPASQGGGYIPVHNLYQSTSGGKSWSPLPVNNVQVVAVDSTGSIVYAFGDGFWSKSTTGGATFSSPMQFGKDVRFAEIDPQNSNIVIIASDQGIFETTNGGSTWSSLNGDLTTSLLTGGGVSSDGKLLVAAAQDFQATPLESFDSGTNWQLGPVSGEAGDALVNPTSGSYVDFYSQYGLYQSNDNGKTFNQAAGVPVVTTVGTCDSNIIAVDSSNTQNVFVASSGGLYKNSNYGYGSWNLINSLSATKLTAAAVDGNTLYVTDQNTLHYSVDGGATWDQLGKSSAPAGIVAVAINPLKPSTVYVGTTSGLYKSIYGGSGLFSPVSGFTSVAVPSGPPCSGVESIDFEVIHGQPVLFVGTGAGLFVSPDLGNTWQSLTFNIIATEITSIHYVGGNLYVTTYGEGFLEWANFVHV